MFNKKFFVILNFIFLCNISTIFSISTVHVFGDSHAIFYFSNNKSDLYSNNQCSRIHEFADEQSFYNDTPFHINWLGPTTMHRVGDSGLNFLDLCSFHVKQNDIAVFVFGEIDVRCHICKQRDAQQKTIDEILEGLVSKYIQTIIGNKNRVGSLQCVVMSVIPPVEYLNPSFPSYGSLEDRIYCTISLNEKLSQECKNNGLKFLNVFNDFATPKGDLNKSLSDGTVHIAMYNNGVVKDKLLQLIRF